MINPVQKEMPFFKIKLHVQNLLHRVPAIWKEYNRRILCNLA